MYTVYGPNIYEETAPPIDFLDQFGCIKISEGSVQGKYNISALFQILSTFLFAAIFACALK